MIRTTLYRNMEQEYNTAVSAYQQINNRSIALQRDLTHQRATEVQIKEQLSVLQQEGLPAGEEDQIPVSYTHLTLPTNSRV